MIRYYVYMYLDLNNIPFYIGKGKNGRHKIAIHLGKYGSNPFLQNKIRKVGIDNIKIHFLHKDLTEKDAFSWEEYWIKYIGRRDKKEGTLCNLTDGGEGSSGHTHSKETKQKMSKAHRNKKLSVKTRQKISKANKGCAVPNERRQKISSTLRGYIVSGETKQKIGAGNKGKTISAKVRQKISESMMGENNHFYGKCHSEESKRKMRAARNRRNEDK